MSLSALQSNASLANLEINKLQRAVSVLYSWLYLLDIDRAKIAETSPADLPKFDLERGAQVLAVLNLLKAESSTSSNTALVYRLNAVLGIQGMS